MAQPEITGIVAFNITVTPIQIAEMKDWDAERIEQFFSGMAQMIRAAGENTDVDIQFSEEHVDG